MNAGAGESSDFARGLALHQQGRLAEAEPLYRRVLHSAPTHFDALHLLGTLCGQTHRFDEARDLLTRALAQQPDSASALVNLGNTLGSLGRHQEAVDAFEQALDARPDDAKALRNRGTSLRALERPAEALTSFDAALALQPDYAEALIGRAECLLTLHRKAQAVEAFRRALPLGLDVEQIHYALASLGEEPIPPSAPAAYVEALFDGYSQNFDKHLVGKLGYRTPTLLMAEILAVHPEIRQHGAALDIVDLGCGTGLCGPLLRPLARRLTGVDLSSQMLAKAEALGLYDELVHGEVASVLAEWPQQFDAAIATDVFVYIGDLTAVFTAVALALRAGGHFGFSVEACAPDASADFHLGPTRRYAHSLGYLQRLAADHGFVIESFRHSVIRQESDEDVNGLLLVLRRA